MKVALTNHIHHKSINVILPDEPIKFYHRSVYPISRRTFKRIIDSVCGKIDCTCSISTAINFKLIADEYNYRSHNDAIDYYIELI